MNTHHVHPRLGLPRFLSFEPFFLEALRAFDRGQDTKFTIEGGLSPSTIAARMRDSIQGLRINNDGWKDRIDPELWELFHKHDGKFVIAGPDVNNEVWFRAAKKRGNPNFAGVPFHEAAGELRRYMSTKSIVRQGGASTPAETSIRATDCSEQIVRSFVTLKALGQLTSPVIFPGPIDGGLIETLTTDADIAFHFDSNRNETILL
jgi:hypothetical protein